MVVPESKKVVNGKTKTNEQKQTKTESKKGVQKKKWGHIERHRSQPEINSNDPIYRNLINK